MFCMKGKISVLRRGIAAFLMLTLIVGNAACLSGTVFAAEVAGNAGKTATVTTSGTATVTTSGTATGTTSGAGTGTAGATATESEGGVTMELEGEGTGAGASTGATTETDVDAEEEKSLEEGMMVLFAQEEGEEASGAVAKMTATESVVAGEKSDTATESAETTKAEPTVAKMTATESVVAGEKSDTAAEPAETTKTEPAETTKAGPAETTKAESAETTKAEPAEATKAESAEATKAESGSSAHIEDASATEPIMSTYVPQKQSVKFGYTGRINYENFHTQYFFVKCNGKKLRAYCIEPTLRWKYKNSYTAKPYDDKLMKKALYYSIGYPGYSVKTKSYLAGVSRKACYKGDKGVYCLCHIVLSYIYDNKKSNSDAFKGVSTSTKKVAKKFLAKIESWPDPPKAADIGLSASSIKAGWNEDAMRQETPTIEVTGTPGNTISVPVPKGATITKSAATADSESATVASSGSVKVAVGESFSLTAPATVQTDYKSPNIYGSMEVFQPYILKTPGSQGQTFGMSARNAVSYNIDWKDFGTIELKKTSSDEETTSGNDYYSLEGAEYGLYSKSTDTLYGKLVTNAEGKATIENIPHGEFYVKELKAPQGYELDSSAHDITIGSPMQTETVLEKPSKPDLETSAVEEETGDKSFYVRDNATGVDTTIVDTVKYKNLTPGLEYRLDARLVDKASGQDIPSQVEKIMFTPEESSGSLQVEYEIDSSDLGGKSAVAFEKLYQGDNLVAVHEDINNKAQTVTILKPIDGAPETGDNLNIVILAIAFGASFVLGVLMFLRRRKQNL